ncbi:hypothetical protein VHEMI08161 [[Torrubiella] hemipterigena]|uniref:Uncharacterized protein n=1 Tax=[Torrubiella] hemipterigena TaxID=1531966 RepID=A0A0A1T5Q6_9HYPO|nr:hypothetical protein VHEMI08161 [[Torrubiella] hemipterigena]
MSGTSIDLSQEEVWDDSALLESWNDALREYKKYHSIHKKGATKADIEALKAERDANNTELEMDLESNTQSEPMVEESLPEIEPTEPAAPLSAALAAPSLHPQVVLGSMKDENLKKMLMSWYYAGYYTGLYEGQQQAAARSSS